MTPEAYRAALAIAIERTTQSIARADAAAEDAERNGWSGADAHRTFAAGMRAHLIALGNALAAAEAEADA